MLVVFSEGTINVLGRFVDKVPNEQSQPLIHYS